MTEYSPAQRRRILVAAIVASSMGFIDGSVISIVTPAIRVSLSASLADVQWVSNAYLLTLSSLLLLGGATGDRFGLRNVFAAGIVLFVLASIASALAGNAAFLITARAVQGIGAAFMVPGSLAIIAEAYPKDQRGGAIGTWAAASSLTTLLGPVLGGALLTWFGNDSWRWVFAINLPLGAIALVLLVGISTRTSLAQKPLDFAGAALATVTLLLISWAFIDGSGWFWAYLGAGRAMLAVFLFGRPDPQRLCFPGPLRRPAFFRRPGGDLPDLFWPLRSPLLPADGDDRGVADIAGRGRHCHAALRCRSYRAVAAGRQADGQVRPRTRHRDWRRSGHALLYWLCPHRTPASGLAGRRSLDDLVWHRYERHSRSDLDRRDGSRHGRGNRNGLRHQQCRGPHRRPLCR